MVTEKRGRKGRVVLGVLVAGLVGSLAFASWPGRGETVGYPLAGATLGNDASPIWRLEPAALERLTVDDAGRLERAAEALERALAHLEEQKPLLGTTKPEALDAAARARVRATWWTLIEPLLALDELKSRYEGWFGVDYASFPGLHSRAYAISFAALCAQVEAGNAVLAAVAARPVAQALFDEAMPEYGLPSGTFSQLRAKIGRAKDASLVPIGSSWYARWIAPHLRDTKTATRLDALVAKKTLAATKVGAVAVTKASLTNETEIVKTEAFRRWFPVQKAAAEWFGDTRVASEKRRLVSDAQLAAMRPKLAPGDVIVERRNWYLSNVGLPGFWPHAALYVGTPAELAAAFDGDEAVKARFGGAFTEHLKKKHPAAMASLAGLDDHGRPHSVLEAVSEGVVTASLEHSCGADYVAAMRTSLAKADVAAAIDRALGFYGRPYDFNFDFATDDAIVCSELVIKAFEPSGEGSPGLRVPWVSVAGRRAVPPTEFVRLFAAERGLEKPQLSFVYFLEGRETKRAAVVATADDLAKSAERPKWDVAQP